MPPHCKDNGATWFIQDGTSLTARVALIIPGAASALPEVVLAAPSGAFAPNDLMTPKVLFGVITHIAVKVIAYTLSELYSCNSFTFSKSK